MKNEGLIYYVNYNVTTNLMHYSSVVLMVSALLTNKHNNSYLLW